MAGSLDLLMMTLVRITRSGRSGQGLSSSDSCGEGTGPPTSQAIQSQQGPCPGFKCVSGSTSAFNFGVQIPHSTHEPSDIIGAAFARTNENRPSKADIFRSPNETGV